MENLHRVRVWIDAGKQVGKSFSFMRDNVMYWSSVAVQKWQDGYKLYIDEIEEGKILSEEYSREQIIFSRDINEIEYTITNTTSLNLSDLAPLKGQRIFSPEFEVTD